MPSFINLMANDVWTAADIKNRLHAEIRSEISEQAETELNRALQGAIMKMHTLTPAEQQALMGFKGATDRVAALGTAARADWLLLDKTLAHEAAVKRLAQLPYTPPDTEPVTEQVTSQNGFPVTPAVDLQAVDASERAAAQAVIDSVTTDVAELVALRDARNNPPTPPMVELEIAAEPPMVTEPETSAEPPIVTEPETSAEPPIVTEPETSAEPPMVTEPETPPVMGAVV